MIKPVILVLSIMAVLCGAAAYYGFVVAPSRCEQVGMKVMIYSLCYDPKTGAVFRPIW